VYTAINSVADPNSAVLLALKQFLSHFLPVISKVDYLKKVNFFLKNVKCSIPDIVQNKKKFSFEEYK
jgi:hypothetical protein